MWGCVEQWYGGEECPVRRHAPSSNTHRAEKLKVRTRKVHPPGRVSYLANILQPIRYFQPDIGDAGAVQRRGIGVNIAMKTSYSGALAAWCPFGSCQRTSFRGKSNMMSGGQHYAALRIGVEEAVETRMG